MPPYVQARQIQPLPRTPTVSMRCVSLEDLIQIQTLTTVSGNVIRMQNLQEVKVELRRALKRSRQLTVTTVVEIKPDSNGPRHVSQEKTDWSGS